MSSLSHSVFSHRGEGKLSLVDVILPKYAKIPFRPLVHNSRFFIVIFPAMPATPTLLSVMIATLFSTVR